MTTDRLRSIVPMFGGATSYVDTLDAILAYVDTQEPTTEALLGWHQGRFDRVESEASIRRRLDYLVNVGFLKEVDGRWQLGDEGQHYVDDQSIETLLEIMCRRNVGLRSLLYALSVGPMTVEEVSEQQLDTHPELGWDPSTSDMALQRVNWLRSMGLVEKDGETVALTDEGRAFTTRAVEQWADSKSGGGEDSFAVGTYETTVQARAVDPEFRATALSQYDRTCPISGVDHPALLDIAHVLPWSEYPEYRSDLGNVLALSKTHHAAFDREFFTIDEDYCMRVNPGFETDCELLERTIRARAGEELELSGRSLRGDHLQRRNANLEWV